MFRAAFPTATDEEERAEASWVKTNFDLSGTNKSGKGRFAGTWVNSVVASDLAETYGLGPLIGPLTEATPDPNVVYRKSAKGQDSPAPSPTAASPPAPATRDGPGPTKRRREASPVTASSPIITASVPEVPPAPVVHEIQFPTPTPRRTTRAKTPTSAATTTQPPPPQSLVSPGPPRRSSRLKSPVPASTPAASVSPKKTPKTMKIIREEETIPASSDMTTVDEDATEAAKATEVDMAEDIREQKELIERLKAERAKKAQVADVDEEMESDTGAVQKRTREEEQPYTLNIREPETEERQIVTNRKVRLLGNLPPQRKSLAWGALLFAAGIGAVTFLPSLPSFL